MKPPQETARGVTLAYLRVSLDKQDLDRQRDTLERLRAKFDWQIELFEDKDEDSEILLEHRPGGKQLLDRFRRGGVVRVWVPELDRLGRSMRVLSAAFHEFEKYPNRPVIEEGMNLERYSFVEDEAKIITTALKCGIATVEKIKIKKRTGEGSWAKAKDAYHWMGGPAPYGYVVEGNRKTAHLVKSSLPTTGNTRLKSKVAVVQHMYAMIADGASCRDVSDYLNKLGIPPQQRKQSPATRWTPGRIRNIIKNEIYMGMHYYGRLKVYRDPDDRRRKPHARKSPVPPLPRPVPELAIVDDKLWKRAVAAMKLNNSANKSHVKPEREYLLKGLIRCACKRKFTASTAHGKDIWYRCPGRSGEAYSPNGQKCDAAAIKGSRLEKAVWEGVKGLIMSPGATLRQLDEQNAAREGADYSVADAIRDREADKAKAIERRKELARQQARNPLPDSDYDELLREANDDIAHIQKDINGLLAQEAEAKLHVAARETARGRLAEWKKKLLAGNLTFDERRQIVRGVVSEICVARSGKITARACFVPDHERYTQRLPNNDTV